MKDNKISYPYAYGMCDSMLRDMAWKVKRECYSSNIELPSALHDLIKELLSNTQINVEWQRWSMRICMGSWNERFLTK